MTQEQSLKPCPFCEGVPKVRKDGECEFALVMKCRPSCGLFGQVWGWYQTVENVVKPWNTRPNNEREDLV